jgi:EpsI family protein
MRSDRRNYIAMLSLLFLSAAAAHLLMRGGERERPPARVSLAEFLRQFEEWKEIDAQTLTPGALRELGADDYLSRTYANDRGAPVFLFIAWYGSQRHRQTFHSPQNCLPGAGWTMSNHKLHRLREASQGEINEYLIEKDGERMVALYWYQGRGRIEASEYWGRLHTIQDSIRLGRTDGALLRVIAPAGKGDGAEEQARQTGLAFVRTLMPLLARHVPD